MFSLRKLLVKVPFRQFSNKNFEFDNTFSASTSKYTLQPDIPNANKPVYLDKPIKENKNIINAKKIRRLERESMKAGRLTKLPKPVKKQIEADLNATPTDPETNRFDKKYIESQKTLADSVLRQSYLANKTRQQKTINTETIVEYRQEERLSKRMAKLGVCSRRQAERLIQEGMVRVDGKKAEFNIPVTSANHVEILTSKGYSTPMADSVALYLYYKPKGVETIKSNKPALALKEALQYTELAGKHMIPIVSY